MSLSGAASQFKQSGAKIRFLAIPDPIPALDCAVGMDEQQPPQDGFVSLSLMAKIYGATGRVQKPGAFATAFFVADGVILTNRHVFSTEAVARRSTLRMFPGTADEVKLRVLHPEDPHRTMYLNGEGESLDFALVSVERGPMLGSTRHFSLFDAAANTVKSALEKDHPIMVAGHPKLGDLSTSFGKVSCVRDAGEAVHYTAKTFSGSSGGPVFNPYSKQLVAVHSVGNVKGFKCHRGSMYGGVKISDIVRSVLFQLRNEQRNRCLKHFRVECDACCQLCLGKAYDLVPLDGMLDDVIERVLSWVAKSASHEKGGSRSVHGCPHFDECRFAKYGCAHIVHVRDEAAHLGAKLDAHLALVTRYADIADVPITVGNGQDVPISYVLVRHHSPFRSLVPPHRDGGILYHLATHGRTRPYCNPARAGLVHVSSFPPFAEGGTKTERWINSNRSTFYSTTDEPPEEGKEDGGGAVFAVDFGPTKRVVVSHYSLKHGQGWKQDSLRSWVFEGAAGGSDGLGIDEIGEDAWVELRRHTDDETLNGAFAEGTWSVEGAEPMLLRHLRIRQTGDNSSGRRSLAVAGFECYGSLLELRG